MKTFLSDNFFFYPEGNLSFAMNVNNLTINYKTINPFTPPPQSSESL